MQPRVVLITQYLSGFDQSPVRADARLLDALRRIGVWVFGRVEDAVWQLREQLEVAHAVIIVFERPEQNIPVSRNTTFDSEIAEVLEFRKNTPRLRVMTVVKRYSEVLPVVSDFPTVIFDDRLEPPHVRDIVEFVFDAARPPVDRTTPVDITTPVDTPDINVLLAQGRVEVSRLAIVADKSEIGLHWPIIAVAVTLVGLALSIPDVLSRIPLSDYWLLLGPIIFIVGLLAAVYLARRHTRGHLQAKMAKFMIGELETLINRLDPLIKLKVSQTTNEPN